MKILQFGNYPIRKPRHGGQKRVAAIHDFLLAQGHQAKYCGIYFDILYPENERGPDDSRISDGRLTALFRHMPHLEDLLISVASEYDATITGRLASLIADFHPDVVQMEQCYVWPLVKRALAVTGATPAIVHSSQNLEWKMKADIYRGRLDRAADSRARIVRLMEEELSAAASLTVCVSEADVSSMGGHTVLAPNSNKLMAPSDSDLAQWSTLRESARTVFLFVGSDHPPNRDGFLAMLGRSLAFLPPDAKIVVAGGVGRAIQAAGYFQDVMAAVNYKRLEFVFQPSDADLGALYQLCDAILLPIQSGGGSNLKTIEALMSQKPVFATSFAFRSFDTFAENNAVTLIDDPNAFQRALQTFSLRQDDPPPIRRDVSRLTWEASLRNYGKLLPRLKATSPPKSNDLQSALSAFVKETETWPIPAEPEADQHLEAKEHHRRLVATKKSPLPSFLIRTLPGPDFVFQAFRRILGRNPNETEYVYYYYAFKRNHHRGKFLKHIQWSELNYRRNAEKYKFLE